MVGSWEPELRVHETENGCRLTLVGLTYGDGASLQEAADDLVARVLHLIIWTRRSGVRGRPALGRPDPRVIGFVRELADLAEAGDDIRHRLLGGSLTPKG